MNWGDRVWQVAADSAQQASESGLLIRRSWQRCRWEFALHPEQRRDPVIVGRDDIRRRRLALGTLFEIAAFEMQSLHAELCIPAGLTLTDTDGVIVYYHGTPAFTREALRAGMREGAIWTEAALGTNGIGTCLAAHAPILIRRDEHFLRQNAALTCCATPVRDGRGRVVAVLNLSYSQGESDAAMLTLVRRCARTVETHALTAAACEGYVVRAHAHPALVASDGAAVIVFNAKARVDGLNAAARRWLGSDDDATLGGVLPAGWQPGADDLARLADVAGPQYVPALGVYVHVEALRNSSMPTESLDQTERVALQSAIEACAWNISAAARRLGIDRKTLHRKLKRHQIFRPF
jgi:transcriptional regulator of acetoin/glycerol metabolism